MKTIATGDTTVLAVAFALAKRGERILMPFSQAERYDLALDRTGGLFRIQCKSGRLTRDKSSIEMKTSGRNITKRYAGDFEI